MPFDFPWLKNPAATSTPNPNPSKSSNPNPFLAIQTHLTSFLSSLPLPRALPPPWARIPSSSSSSVALPVAEIEDRLSGVPVYALANSAQEFVLVSKTHGSGAEGESSSARPPPALGVLCFRKEDADALLAQMGGNMRAGSTVVPVALNKSRSLVLMSDSKRYRPVFFRKEDLDNSLHRASRDQQKPNPVVRIGDTQVSSLEDIITSMKDSSSSKWDDVVFIPPGFDLATGSK